VAITLRRKTEKKGHTKKGALLYQISRRKKGKRGEKGDSLMRPCGFAEEVGGFRWMLSIGEPKREKAKEREADDGTIMLLRLQRGGGGGENIFK